MLQGNSQSPLNVDNSRHTQAKFEFQQLGKSLIQAYLADKSDEGVRLLSVLRRKYRYYYNGQKLQELMVKVFDKLGEDKLQKICDNQNITTSTKFFELIGDFFNKLCRILTCGLAGYTFSDIEAREAIEGGLNVNYNQEKKSFLGLIDNNTRFAQLAQSKGIVSWRKDNNLNSRDR